MTSRTDGVTRVSTADVRPRGWQVARALDRAGVGRRATVAILAGNTPEFVWLVRGATWSGRRVVPLSWRWSARDLEYVLQDSAAEALVIDARYADLVAPIAGSVDLTTRLAFGAEAVDGFDVGFDDLATVLAAESGDDYASTVAGDLMLYTSGTTGRPKGVMRPQSDEPPPTFAAARGAVQLARTPGSQDGPHLVCTPMYHAAPIFYAEGALLSDCDLVLMERFDPERVLALIEEHRIASTFMVPTQFVRLLSLPPEVRARYDLSSLRLVVHGAAPVAPHVKRSMIEWLGPILYETYGGSEGCGSTGISSPEWLAHPGSVGRIISGTAIRILGDDGEDLPPGVEGEVWFEGEQEWSYRDAPEKTAQARRGGLSTLGDIGYLDEEGYLYLCDRRTDVIITGGMNVYPAQVEAVLLEHPDVIDACVIGLPDEEWGQRVAAIVELRAGRELSASLQTDLIAFSRERLAGYQTPRSVDTMQALPRTETGKISRSALRAEILGPGGTDQ